jgi:hypothetical protein
MNNRDEVVERIIEWLNVGAVGTEEDQLRMFAYFRFCQQLYIF